MHLYLPETKEQSKQWLEPRDAHPQKAIQGRGTRYSKAMLVMFFDSTGVVHREFIRNETITGKVYTQILDRLLISLQHRCTRLWRNGDFVLHHDNAPVHTSDLTEAWIGRRHVHILEHPPPYSPDLAPNDFWLFPTLKKAVRGVRFPDLNTMEFEIDRHLGLIPQNEFQRVIHTTWVHRLNRCVRSNSAYFEGIPQ